jgi:cell division protein FtsL
MARTAAARALPAPARRRARPKPRAARRPAPRRRVASGVVWIGIVGVLLAGVVAINVAVLRLNMQLDDVGRERAQLRADNAQLNTEIAARAASGRIVTTASTRLGVAPVTAENRTYLDLRR